VADPGAGQTGTITNRITLTTSSKDLIQRLSFEASNDLKSWRHLGDEDYISGA
jgi:hypothetical protein